MFVSIRSKITLLLAVGLVVVSMVGATAVSVDRAKSGKYSMSKQCQALALNVSRNMMYEEQYITWKDESILPRIEEVRSANIDLLKNLRAEADGDDRQLIEQIAARVEARNTLFEEVKATEAQVAAQREEYDALLATLSAAIQAVIGAISEEESFIAMEGGLLSANESSLRDQLVTMQGLIDKRLIAMQSLVLRKDFDQFRGQRDALAEKSDRDIKGMGSLVRLTNKPAYQKEWGVFQNAWPRLVEQENGMLAQLQATSDKQQVLRENGTEIQALVSKGVGNSEDAIARMDKSSMLFGVSALVGGGVLLLGIGMFTIRSSTRPVTMMTEVMRRLAGGDTAVEIPGSERTDEIGSMAQAVAVFKENAIEKARMEQEKQSRDIRAAAEKKEMVERMVTAFEADVGGIISQVVTDLKELEHAMGTMAASIEQTRDQSATVATASEETSQNVLSVSAATEELIVTIDEISRQVAQSTRSSENAVSRVEESNQSVSKLADAAGKIDEVIELISTIAEQTKLLALNATIEAARAGEAGKGFAVVAGEVKELARQTDEATGDIGEQVKAIQGAVGDTVQLIRSIAQAISENNDISTAIAAAIEQQGTTTKDIAASIQNAASGTRRMSDNISSVAVIAKETGGVAAEMSNKTANLSRHADRLQEQVERFLAQLRG